MLGHVGSAIWTPAGLTALDGNASFGSPVPVGSEGRSRQRGLSSRSRLSGTSETGAGPTARMLNGPIQLRDDPARGRALVLSMVTWVPFLAPWRMVSAEL